MSFCLCCLVESFVHPKCLLVESGVPNPGVLAVMDDITRVVLEWLCFSPLYSSMSSSPWNESNLLRPFLYRILENSCSYTRSVILVPFNTGQGDLNLLAPIFSLHTLYFGFSFSILSLNFFCTSANFLGGYSSLKSVTLDE